MFEEMTYENILTDLLDTVSEDVDTREGSIYYDAVNAFAIKSAELFTQAGVLYDQLQLSTATGESLELIGAERLVKRKDATHAEYNFIWEGEVPPLGAMFYSEDGIYFTLLQADNGTYYLESVETGTENNNVTIGTKAIPTETYTDLKAASFGELIIPAIDTQTDDEYRQSIIDSIVPGENGNIQHYKNWCREVDSAVGNPRIIPCADGPNTVKAVIITTDGKAASRTLLDKIQAYVDPDNDGDGMGDGLGEGVANIGAHFTAIAPNEVKLNVYINGLILSQEYDTGQVKTLIINCIENYFKDLTIRDNNYISVKASEMGAKIQALDCVDSYNYITFSDTELIYSKDFGITDIPVLGNLIGVDNTL